MAEGGLQAGGPAPWVIVAPGFHSDGGMERSNLELARYLLGEGVRVHLVTFRADGDLAGHDGATLHLVRRPARSYLLGEWLLERTGRSVAAEVTRGHPGTRVLVNGGNCQWGDLNWVHYVHHAWRASAPTAPWWFWAKEGLLSRSARRREAVALGRARLVFANSRRTATDLVGLLELPSERIRTVYLGVDPAFGPVPAEERAAARQSLGQQAHRPLLLFVGALGYDRRKGFDTLWKAWRELCARGDWDADLLVAGGGREASYWNGLVRSSGLSSCTRLLGFTDRVADLLAAADLLVSPVRYESYGLNVQEAICRGVPAMVSATAGVAERYPSTLRHLLLDDPENVRELHDRLLVWRERMDETRAAVEPLAATLRARTWREMAAEMVALANGTGETGAGRPRAPVQGMEAGRR